MAGSPAGARWRTAGNGFVFDLREVSGALGDLGTLLPLMLGVIAVAGLAPVPVVLGFALAYIATGCVYRLPVPVQPMKAVAAVLLTTSMSPAAIVASGVMIGAVLLLLGATGWIDRFGRAVPQSVMAGLQLGLGIALGIVAVGLIAGDPLLGLASVALLGVLLHFPAVPAALVVVVGMTLLGQALGAEGLAVAGADSAWVTIAGLPDLAELQRALGVMVLPQLSLTLTNAVLLTALVAGDAFGERARHVTPRRLAITSGLGNLFLTPFGALPMCHGAGGVVAHHRFGARSGAAPLMLGLALAVLALLPGGAGLALLGAVPVAVLGALLLFAAAKLALGRRLFDCRPSCRPVIAVTAGVTLMLDPFWGLVAGGLAEAARMAMIRALRGPRHS